MRGLAALSGLLLAGSAHADATEFATGLHAIPVEAWALATAIALVGGATRVISLLSKVPPAIELAPAPILSALWLSLLGGLLGFFGGLGLDASPPYLVILVFAGAVAGTAAIDAIRDRVLSVLQTPTDKG